MDGILLSLSSVCVTNPFDVWAMTSMALAALPEELQNDHMITYE